MRLIRTGTDLSGRTIDVSTLPEGHARQSYIGRCDLRGATIIGDIRGSDILQCQAEGLDLSQAWLHGCEWKGTSFDDASIFPSDVGVFGGEITRELVRRYIPSLPTRWRQRAKDIIDAHAAGDFQEFTSLAYDVYQRDPDVLANLIAGMPENMKHWLKNTLRASFCVLTGTSQVIEWPDGVTVSVDSQNLPSLPRPFDRYELARWIEAQAGPGHYCWVRRLRPWLSVTPLGDPDAWLVRHN